MAIKAWFNVKMTMCFLICLAVGVSAFAQAAPESTPGSELEKLKGSGGKFSLTVLPLVVPDVPVDLGTRIEFSKGLALMLERTGIKSIEVSSEHFADDSATLKDMDRLEKSLQSYLKQHPIKTDYVYCMEYCGKPHTPAEAIITIVANPKGEIVWKLYQDSKDETFQKMKPDQVMVGEIVSVEPFRQLVALADPMSKDAYAGEWAGYFNNKSKKASPETKAAAAATKDSPAPAPVAASSINPTKIYIGVISVILVILIGILGYRMATKKTGS